MRSKVAERILAETPADVTIFVKWYGDLLVKINSRLKEKGYTQKMLAEKLEKHPSEIHRWLSGEHNFTLRSLAKLQSELGDTLLEIPTVNKPINVFVSYKNNQSFTVYKNVQPPKKVSGNWQDAAIFQPKKMLENVG